MDQFVQAVLTRPAAPSSLTRIRAADRSAIPHLGDHWILRFWLRNRAKHACHCPLRDNVCQQSDSCTLFETRDEQCTEHAELSGVVFV
jgi:hypothetical protein